MNKITERENVLLDILKTRTKLSTNEAKKILNISESSTRRIFHNLEEEGKIIRVYGGIKLAKPGDLNYSFIESESKNLPEKRSIAVRASQLVENNDIVYLDCGTTIQQLAIAIKTRIQNNDLRDIRIITNSMVNMQILNDYCVVVLIGGQYREHRKDFAGFASEKFVQNFKFSKSFLGADGFTIEDGFMATDTDTARLNEIIVTCSGKNYVLMDSSKIDSNSFVRYAPVVSIEALITDPGITDRFKSLCANSGFKVIISDN